MNDLNDRSVMTANLHRALCQLASLFSKLKRRISAPARVLRMVLSVKIEANGSESDMNNRMNKDEVNLFINRNLANIP